MYRITRKIAGGYACEGMLQDGTERWKEDEITEAIKSMVSFAKTMNNTDITTNDIEFYEEYPTQAVQVRPYEYKPRTPLYARNGGIFIRTNMDSYSNSYYPSQPLYEVVVSFSNKTDAQDFKDYLEGLK